MCIGGVEGVYGAKHGLVALVAGGGRGGVRCWMMPRRWVTVVRRVWEASAAIFNLTSREGKCVPMRRLKPCNLAGVPVPITISISDRDYTNISTPIGNVM